MQHPATEPSSPPSSIPWPPLLLIGAVAGSLAMDHVYPITWPGENDIMARIVGLGFGAAGIALLAWAIVTLKAHGTVVRPDRSAVSLVTDGPYRFRRNPIYIADVLILFGVAELTKNIWFVGFAILFAVLVTWLAILPEERHLEETFGEAYRDYKARTRRWI